MAHPQYPLKNCFDVLSGSSVEIGDIVVDFSKPGPPQISLYDGGDKPSYLKSKCLKENGLLSAKFFLAWMNLPSTQHALKNHIAMNNHTFTISWSHMERFSVPVPPPQQQESMLQTYDKSIVILEKYIEMQKKRVDLLQQMKDSLTHQFISEGLDDIELIKYVRDVFDPAADPKPPSKKI